MKKVLFYVTEEEFVKNRDSTRHIYEGLQLYPQEFELVRCGKKDPSQANDADIIFCRFEIPIDERFLTELSQLEGTGKLFINSPTAKMYEHSKRNLRSFIDTDILPPTCISANPDELVAFTETLEGRLLVKPIDLNGGRGIERYNHKSMSPNEIYAVANALTGGGAEEAVFQQYIEGVETMGDKRINIFMYEPIAATVRKPKEGSFICNMSAGASMHTGEITERDRHIVETLEPFLREKGITWAGIDVLGDYLGELNVSSPGMLKNADELTGNTLCRDRAVELLRLYANGY